MPPAQSTLPTAMQPALPRPSVLIVDSSADNREVLRTVLARRGMQILEAPGPDEGLALAREHHPDVVVLDLEGQRADAVAIREQFSAQTRRREQSIIILGRLRRSAGSAGCTAFAGSHVIGKPYHFAPLVHTIEQLAAKAA